MFCLGDDQLYELAFSLPLRNEWTISAEGWTKRENPPGERGKSVKMRCFQLGEIDRQKTVETATTTKVEIRPH